MNEPQLQPYLSFDGNCEEAMKFYQSVLGGELEISRFKDYASEQMPIDKAKENQVMHSTLKNEGMTFMASDAAMRPPNAGDNISLSVAGNDEQKLRKIFEGLSADGKVDVRLEKQVWGDTFGMCTDKFGIHWMINISAR